MTLLNPSDQTITQYNVQTGGATNTLNNVAPSGTSGVPLISQGAASQPIFGTAVVAGGGTGATSFTAYSVICGGTTSTNPLQNVSGVGTAGQVLTSNGAATLPTWQAASAGSGFTTIAIQVFTSNGTYTPTASMKYCIIEALGGGGAGGGTAATDGGHYGCSTGGSAGEYARGTFSAATIGASQAVTIGAGGTPVSGGTGGNAGNTSVGALISANGGLGGNTTSTASVITFFSPLGGTGGAGGSFRSPGALAATAFVQYLGAALPSTGANTLYGAGGLPGANADGSAGLGYGSGGGGVGVSGGIAAKSGGAGAAGLVVVTEFI